MSIASDVVVCTKCEYKGHVHHQPITLAYEFDGKVFQTGRLHGWCMACDGPSDIEPKFNEQEIKDEIEPLIDQLKKKSTFFAKIIHKAELRDLENVLSELFKKLHIAKHRLSPQRCLRCGSGNVRDLSQFGKVGPKHHCGGHLYIREKTPEEDEIRYIFKAITTHLDREGIRRDRSGYSAQHSLKEPYEYVLHEVAQEVIEVGWEIEELLKTVSKNPKFELELSELTYYGLALITYVMLRFSTLLNKESFLDQLTEITLKDLSFHYEDEAEEILLSEYHIKYKSYCMDFDLIFEKEAGQKGHPQLYLSRQLYENITGISSKSHLVEVMGISAYIGEQLINKVKFVQNKINSIGL
jgi:hypothetical protein